jgi:hypothetical protein
VHLAIAAEADDKLITRAARAQQVGPGKMAAVQHALDVDLDQRMVACQRIVRERAGDQDAGIVDQQVPVMKTQACARLLSAIVEFICLRNINAACRKYLQCLHGKDF